MRPFWIPVRPWLSLAPALALATGLGSPVLAAAQNGTTTPVTGVASPTLRSPQAIREAQRTLSGTGLEALLTLSGHSVSIGGSSSALEAARTLTENPQVFRAGPWAASLPVLEPMAQGNVVRVLQERLKGAGARLAVDGVYGPATWAALHAFETGHGVQVSDRVGVAVWTTLLGIRVAADHRSIYALAQTYDTTPLSLVAWNPDLRLSAQRWSQPLTAEIWLMPGDILPSSRTLGSDSFPTAQPVLSGTGSGTHTRGTGAGTGAGTGKGTQAKGSAKTRVAQPPKGTGRAPSSTKSGPAKSKATQSAPGTTVPKASGGGPSSAPSGSQVSSQPLASRNGPSRPRFFALVLAIGPTVTTRSLDALAAYMGGAGVTATVAVSPPVAEHDASAVRALSLMGADVAIWVRSTDGTGSVDRAAIAITQATGSRPYLAYAGSYPSAGEVLAASRAHLGMLVVSRVLSSLAVQGSAPGAGTVLAVQTTPQAAIADLKSFVARAKVGGVVPGPALSLISSAP